MRVKDLLEQLKGADPEAEIGFQVSDGCCGDYEDLSDPVDVDVWEADKKYFPKGFVQIRFPPLWFMDTCITSGQAKKAAEEHKKRTHGENWRDRYKK